MKLWFRYMSLWEANSWNQMWKLWHNFFSNISCKINIVTYKPLLACCWTTARPRLLKRSLPIISLCASSTTVKHACFEVQSLYVTVVAICPSTLICSFEKVFKSLTCFVVNYFAVGVVLRVLFASVSVMKLTTLPESNFALTRTLPILILTMRASSGCSE